MSKGVTSQEYHSGRFGSAKMVVGEGRKLRSPFTISILVLVHRHNYLCLLCCAILQLMLPQGNTSASMSISTVVIRKLNFAMLPSLSMAHPDWGLEQCITRH